MALSVLEGLLHDSKTTPSAEFTESTPVLARIEPRKYGKSDIPRRRVGLLSASD